MKWESQVLYPFLFLLLCCLGCGESRPDRDEITPAEFFNQTQEGTVTPNGRVVPGSARDVDGGIQYGTEDGSTFEVSPRPTAQGGYRYENPRKVEPQGK